MAILKHLASKNANYGDALRYLMFEHDALSKKPLLDDGGHLVMRTNFIIDGLECAPATFDIECSDLNRQYRQNENYNDIKSHHYIISFDPKDKTDSGLTVEKAQSIGMDYAKKNFPGHQTLVCTHEDGDNHSGNIHVHIVFNSVRKNDVERQDFMERKCDSRAGYKHHLTHDYRRYPKKDLMKTCISLGLHQVDLLSPAKDRITEKEHWAKARGQKKLDEANRAIIENGGTPQKTTFQTQKDGLRDAIRRAASVARNEKEFAKILKEKYGVTLKISRGRYSYLHPERTKPITGRKLGEDFRETALRPVFAKNAKRSRLDIAGRSEKQSSPVVRNKPQERKADAPASKKKDRMVQTTIVARLQENQQKIKEHPRAYERKVQVNKLKESAEALAYMQEHGYPSEASLKAAYDYARQKTAATKQKLDAINADITALNAQIHYIGQYLSRGKLYKAFLNAKNKKQFRAKYKKPLEEYESARSWLQKQSKDGTLPSYKFIASDAGRFPLPKKLKEVRDEQIAVRNPIRQRYNENKKREKELRSIYKKAEELLHSPTHDQQIQNTKPRRTREESL